MLLKNFDDNLSQKFNDFGLGWFGYSLSPFFVFAQFWGSLSQNLTWCCHEPFLSQLVRESKEPHLYGF